MTGALCLQGGREFTPDCRAMDADFLDRVRPGPVAVLAGAARVGDDYDGASDRARRHYESLGREVVVVPDPRTGPDAALASLGDDLAAVVLPGGSPASLLDVLDGDVGDRLLALHESDMSISGASAGAMVTCSRMIRPDGPGGPDVVDGLGLFDGLALPHWSPGRTRNWPVPDDITLWGLPECGGILIDAHDIVAVGHGTPSRRDHGTWRAVPRP